MNGSTGKAGRGCQRSQQRLPGSINENRPKAVCRKRAHDAHRPTHARVGKPGSYAPVSPHGVGVGTAHGPSTSIDLKSAGPTISRYSMSGE